MSGVHCVGLLRLIERKRDINGNVWLITAKAKDFVVVDKAGYTF